LSIIIPAFNEAKRLPDTLEKTAAFCAGFKQPVEVLVVVEKCHDGTLELALQAAARHSIFRVIDNRVHRGKGFAVRSGMLQARGNCLLFMDADLSVPLDEIPVFLDYFEKHPGVDLLIGNRRHPQSDILRRQTWLRQKMGRMFNLILRGLAPVAVRDTQCGFKAFRARAAREIFSRQRLDGFAFDAEVLLLADKLGFQSADLPVRWINSPDSRVRIVRDSLRMLYDLIRIRLRLF
jgi:glycosyltransferase involved in cell wall biosynthesis